MAEEDLVQFLHKVGELNAFVALIEAQPDLRRALRDCAHHHEVVALARRHGFEIGRRWGDQQPRSTGN
jgi:cupin 2 domain-containing protein